MSKKVLIGAVAGAAALLAPAAAQAHVTLNPRDAAASSFTKLDVRVPTERDDASTTKVEVLLPPGFVSASYQPQPGWSVKVSKTKLDTPVKTDDGEVTEQVSRITWTGTGKGVGKIGPGQFMDFPLSVQIPGKAGDTLTFKALQTYSDGQVVRWIGSESSDHPAPTVQVTAAAGAHEAAATATPVPATSGGGASSGSGDSGSDGLAIVALVVGALGLLAGGAALATGRRRAGAAA